MFRRSPRHAAAPPAAGPAGAPTSPPAGRACARPRRGRPDPGSGDDHGRLPYRMGLRTQTGIAC